MNIFTFIHVLISLAGIGSGVVVLYGLLGNKWFNGWTTVFLATTVATSVTGFGFPFVEILPSHIVGALSLAVLGVAIFALRSRKLDGPWRVTYVVTSMLALYFNVFVLVVQSFIKIPTLQSMAPTQTEPPFIIAQSIVFIGFGVLTILAAVRFRIRSLPAGSFAS